MAKYPFLSDEWIAQARALHEELNSQVESPEHVVLINQVVTDVPFGDGSINAHLSTANGALEVDLGHLDQADVTVTLDYETARSFLVGGDPTAALAAFMQGRVKVQGDLTKLLAFQAAANNPLLEEVVQRLRDFTEPAPTEAA